jgi:hypothetical protein
MSFARPLAHPRRRPPAAAAAPPQELEQQLKSTAEEKVQVQSKFHELSIKHRQLIETSPQIASIWNEVLVQQAGPGGGRDAAAINRASNFDLRHTGAGDALEHVARAAAAAGGGGLGAALDSEAAAAAAARLGGTAVIDAAPIPALALVRTAWQGRAEGAPAPPLPAASSGGGAPAGASSGGRSPVPRSSDAGAAPAPAPAAAAASGEAASAPGGGDGEIWPSHVPEGQRVLQSAEERAAALMASVALEGLSPDAQVGGALANRGAPRHTTACGGLHALVASEEAQVLTRASLPLPVPPGRGAAAAQLRPHHAA